MSADLERKVREAALDHGEWLEADHDETNYDAYVAGYLAAATLREKEIATLRARVAELSAKLEAVPVEEMKAIVEWELGLDYPCEASAAIDRWLATETKP